jgi:sec-independent protein translocase protein TatC
MVAEMSFREHLDELRVRVLHVALAIIIITIFAMTFDLRPINVGGGIPLAYPFPDPINNIATRTTLFMQQTLLPDNVTLVQTQPGQAFFAQVYVSLLIGLLASMPVIVREISGFISPAISSKTKIGVLNVFLPAAGLFAAGILFSYFLVIPFVLDFLYQYGEAIGVLPLINVSDFISFVMQFFLGFGIAFQLPILMYVSLTGAMSPRFWRNNFRYAVVILVVFGAVITPDGSGITMWFVAGPMTGLYLIGMVVVERRAAKAKTNT